MSLRTRLIVYAVLLSVVVGLLAWRFGSRWAEHRDATTVEAGRSGLEDFLEPWYEALENQDREAAKVVVMGDSLSEGVLLESPVWPKRMPYLLQQELRKEVGAHGRYGYLAAYYADVLTPEDVVRAGRPEPREETLSAWGLGGRSLAMPGGTSVTYPKQEAERVRVWFGRAALFGGEARVRVDGKDRTLEGQLSDGTPSRRTISSAGSANESGLWWISPELGPGEHEVSVESTVPELYFPHSGVEFLGDDLDSGVHVYDGSASGATARRFASDVMAKGHWEDVRAIDPQLLLVNLGTIVETDEGVTYAEALETVVTRALEAAPRARVVLVDGYRSPIWEKEDWEEVRRVRKAVAERHSDRVAVFDLASRWPRLKKDGSTNEGLMYEGEPVPLHPSAKGQQRMAEIYARLLTPPKD